MSSRLLSIATVVSMTSGAALACTQASAKSADGSQQQSISTATRATGS
jgi:hypothetical protein